MPPVGACVGSALVSWRASRSCLTELKAARLQQAMAKDGVGSVGSMDSMGGMDSTGSVTQALE